MNGLLAARTTAPALILLCLGLTACGSDASSSPSSRAAQPSARVYAVGPAGTESAASGLNQSGQVVGTSQAPREAARGTQANAFVWDDGEVNGLDLGAARAINDRGDVAGEWNGLAVLQSSAGALAFGTGTAHHVNDRGQVVGEVQTGEGPLQAFLWDGRALTLLPGLGGAWSVAYGVNEAGQVAGWAEGPDGSPRAVRWEAGEVSDLGTLGGAWSMAYAINELGETVGYAATGKGTDHAFLCGPDGTMLDLGSLGGYSVAYGVDNLGRVVGEASSGGEPRAFLWEAGTLTDLNTLLPPGSGWILLRALAINDAGQIVGEGLLNGRKTGFLLEISDQ